jgi:hypothetical protein
MDDVAGRLASRVQLTSDGHRVYLDAVLGAFDQVDFAQLVKLYGSESGSKQETFFAISERRSEDRLALRAFAPASPDLVFLDEGLVSSISPVAILATMIAAAAVSAGRFCPCGPFGIIVFSKTPTLRVSATVAINKTAFHVDNFKLRHYRNLTICGSD